jgi:hypothetical protein
MMAGKITKLNHPASNHWKELLLLLFTMIQAIVQCRNGVRQYVFFLNAMSLESVGRRLLFSFVIVVVARDDPSVSSRHHDGGG